MLHCAAVCFFLLCRFFFAFSLALAPVQNSSQLCLAALLFLACKNSLHISQPFATHTQKQQQKESMPPPTRRERGKMVTTINAATQATHTKFVSPQSTPKGRREKKNDDLSLIHI